MHPLPLQGPLDGDEDGLLAEGLGDKIVGALLDGLFRGLNGAVGGNDNDGHGGVDILDDADEVDAIHQGHFEIGDEDGEGLGHELFEGFLAVGGGIGGAMDLLSGKCDLIIVLEHTDSKGRPKLRKQCTYPLTGQGCVSYVVTDLTVLRWDGKRFVIDAVAPGFTTDEIIAMTEMDIVAGPNVREME